MLEISDERCQKIRQMKNQKARVQSLGAGVLLAYGLRQYGIQDKNATMILGENGKPYLAGDTGIYFNLSHSGDYVVAAFGECEVGIDIENKHSNGLKIAKRFFTAKESTYLASCPAGQEQADLFLRYWTLKESFLKITGRGMRLPLDSFELTVGETVTVDWSEDNRNYYFKEFSFESEESEKYRIAVCALECEIAPEIIWMR